MELVSAYETSDGQIFKSKPLARKHQAELDLRAIVDWITDKFSVNNLDYDMTAGLLQQRVSVAQAIKDYMAAEKQLIELSRVPLPEGPETAAEKEAA